MERERVSTQYTRLWAAGGYLQLHLNAPQHTAGVTFRHSGMCACPQSCLFNKRRIRHVLCSILIQTPSNILLLIWFCLFFVYPQVKGDVASLVRSLLGPIYGEAVLDILIRQARDILVCAYHGNLVNFVKSYLLPASELLARLKRLATQTVSNK